MNIMFFIVTVLFALSAGTLLGALMTGGKRAQQRTDQATLHRYRLAIADYRRWLCEMPDVARLLSNLSAEAEGAPLNAGTPHGMEHCTVSGLRDQLRKIRAGLPKTGYSPTKDTVELWNKIARDVAQEIVAVFTNLQGYRLDHRLIDSLVRDAIVAAQPDEIRRMADITSVTLDATDFPPIEAADVQRDGILCAGTDVAENRFEIPIARWNSLFIPATDAWADVVAERFRQVDAEGWTKAHDDQHDAGDLASASSAYALSAASQLNPHSLQMLDEVPVMWPLGWDSAMWKPSTPRRDLVKSCALALAEIERLDRAAPNEAAVAHA